jgi:predicted phage terminase large subunit-like protein
VLWEEQRSYDWLMAEKQSMGSYLFNAIYQGQPIERDGNIFKRSWFMDETTNRIYNLIDRKDLPTDLPMMRYWDFAASGKEGDGTSGLLTGYDGENLYFIDLIAGKFSSSETLKVFKRTAKRDGKSVLIKIEQEPGAGSKLLINQFRRNPEFKQYNIRGDKVKLKKNVRSFNLEALAEAGRIYWLRGDWNLDIINHLVSFTGEDGKPDDITDSLTGSCNIWKKPKRKVYA